MWNEHMIEMFQLTEFYVCHFCTAIASSFLSFPDETGECDNNLLGTLPIYATSSVDQKDKESESSMVKIVEFAVGVVMWAETESIS